MKNIAEVGESKLSQDSLDLLKSWKIKLNVDNIQKHIVNYRNCIETNNTKIIDQIKL